ncbi:MAG: right-handed parallel beta-helix repeat-containing protein [Planctomycetes bacterium]|nr:right-handed parallel beta-helix repeat-containing protein [Planctomycetota bacterium]
MWILLAFTVAAAFDKLTVPKEKPLEVRRSASVVAGTYVRPPLGAGGRGGVIVIANQKKVELDLTGVELRGVAKGTDLDQCSGFGLVVRDCEDVTIKGGVLGGYKGCIVATNTKGLVLDGITFDGFYGKHLLSTLQAEDGSDWLYPHENDADQWITNYGGAISLTDCDGATIRNCKARHGQNGILLTRSNGAKVEKNDASFLSGWGLAMYRSSKALVTENTFDYCVRGYSHDAYWRGQDSAGILMFERCCDNVFTWNSATHGGDGVFLYAGQDTVEGRAFAKGEQDAGGSDRNVWYENDFSFAVANAIEATFSSDNWAIRNRLDGSHQHGVWGGYSRRMVVLGNSIQNTLGGGVSIEHGQDCVFADNTFAKNEMAIELWWDEDKELVQGPFGQHRDTSSRDMFVLANAFEGNATDLILRDTQNVSFAKNRWDHEGNLEVHSGAKGSGDLEPLVRDWVASDGKSPNGKTERSTLAIASGDEPEILTRARAWRPASTSTGGAAASRLRPRPEKEGLDTIVMGEWGPWDFRSGEPKPVQKQSGGLLAKAQWDARWFAWTAAADPREKLAEWRALALHPLATKRAPNFVDPWAGDKELRAKTTTAHFGVIATTHIDVTEAGTYRLAVLSDDGVRVTIDGRKGVENWTWHAPTRDEVQVKLTKGPHELDLEYFQIDGAYALLVELEKVP